MNTFIITCDPSSSPLGAELARLGSKRLALGLLALPRDTSIVPPTIPDTAQLVAVLDDPELIAFVIREMLGPDCAIIQIFRPAQEAGG
jgi:hypothetical protein